MFSYYAGITSGPVRPHVPAFSTSIHSPQESGSYPYKDFDMAWRRLSSVQDCFERTSRPRGSHCSCSVLRYRYFHCGQVHLRSAEQGSPAPAAEEKHCFKVCAERDRLQVEDWGPLQQQQHEAGVQGSQQIPTYNQHHGRKTSGWSVVKSFPASQNIQQETQQILYFLRLLRKRRLSGKLLLHRELFNILCLCLCVCCQLHRGGKESTPEGHHHQGCPLPSLEEAYSSRCLNKAPNIVKDSPHPGPSLFELLPSGRGCRAFKTRTDWKTGFTPEPQLH